MNRKTWMAAPWWPPASSPPALPLPRKSSPSGGSRASTRPRTTRCSRPSRSSRPSNKGVKIELSQYPIQDMIPKTVAALDSGSPPDVAYADTYDFQVTAKWAYDGKLEDISSVIDPLRAKFEPRALSTTFLLNNTNQTRAYYAFPLKQQTMHIQYWKDMLAEAGFKESDIPKDWKGYWDFWCARCSRPTARRPAARLRHRHADGRGLHRLVLLVPDLHGRVQRHPGQRLGQGAGRRPDGARRT